MSFLLEYMDSTLGMGYGTTLTPLLLLFGFEPLQIIPAVLLSQVIAGLLAGFVHHSVGNVNFGLKIVSVKYIMKELKGFGFIQSFNKSVSSHLKITLLLALCGIAGTLTAVFVATNISTFCLKLYIGILVLTMGLFILFTRNKHFTFLWKKIIGLALIASFNKGISGGGYGPVIVGGQLLSGVDGKNAIGIAALSEGLICIVGVLAYIVILKNTIDWVLAPYLLIGAIFAVPFSAFTVKKLRTKHLRVMIGAFTFILGIVTLGKIL